MLRACLIQEKCINVCNLFQQFANEVAWNIISMSNCKVAEPTEGVWNNKHFVYEQSDKAIDKNLPSLVVQSLASLIAD